MLKSLKDNKLTHTDYELAYYASFSIPFKISLLSVLKGHESKLLSEVT